MIFTLLSCSYYTPKKVLNCEPIKPECRPESFNETKIDTSSNKKLHFKIERVRGLSTEINEWALSFYGKDDALFTYGNNNKQVLRKYTFISPTILNSGKVLEYESKSPYGMASASNKIVYFASEIDFLSDELVSEYRSKGETIPIKYLPGKSRLYKGQIEDNKLVNVSKLKIGDSLSIFDWESHPAISPNGKVLFFSSTRESEDNGTQLYFASIDASGELSNIGEVVKANSTCDEISPFVSNDGKRLYFSSNGHSTVGGYDIFYCDIQNEFWTSLDSKYISAPINVGKPINTRYDEAFPSSPQSPENLFYYSSNQAGNFDMYVLYENTLESIDIGEGLKAKVENVEVKVPEKEVVVVPEPVTPPVPEPKKEEVKVEVVKKYFSVEGEIVDENKKALSNVDVKVRKQGEERVSYETRSDEFGKYELSLEKGVGYEVRAQDGEHFYDTFYISKEDSEKNDIFKKEFVLDQSLDIRINFPYDVYDKPYDNIIDEQGFETNKNWKKELDEIAKNIIERIDYIKVIVLTGHTDMHGSQDYNGTLGLNRAKFVCNELIARGIPKNKLTFKSMGKLAPLKMKEHEPEEYYSRRLRRVNLEIINK